jgi:hypothetical protein
VNPTENENGPVAGAVFEADARRDGSLPDVRTIGADAAAARKTSRLLVWRKAVAATSNLSSTQKLVALVLSLHMNGDGASCFPSQETIAAEASLGLRAVRDALKTLDDRDYIAREGGRFRGDVTRYRATLPASERRQDGPPSEERRQLVPASDEGKAASADAEGGTSFHERRHDVPTRTSGGRPEDVGSDHEENDAVAPEGRSGSTWEVASVSTLDAVETFATEAEAVAFAGKHPDLFPRPVAA